MLGTPKLYERDPNAVLVPVRGVFIHQDYSVGTLINDIAVVLLAYPVNFSSYIQPVCLAEKMMEVKAGTPCWVTGWGRTVGIRSSPKPGNLQELEVYIVDTDECKMKINEAVGCYGMGVRRGMVCSYRQQGQSPCWGDSGGPLVCEINETWIQVGIVSWGVDCGVNPLPTMYTHVSEYMDWITAILSQAACMGSMGVCQLLLCLELLLLLLLAIVVPL
ncbi:serine protease 44-like [Ochotona princeps]|uniref:serine protease 44-like n=1 Tax=Ochotona princeps TaxID=9978 RepID=UPI0027146DCC|nr:serine protease 44-like [Ochotona princeps]